MSSLTRLRLKQKILIAALLPVLLFLAATWVVVAAAADIRAADEQVIQASATEEAAWTVEVGFLTMDAALRGFVASGNEPLYAPYEPAHQSVIEALDRLQAKGSNERVRERAEDVRELIQAYHVNRSTPLAALVRSNGSDEALDAWRQNAGEMAAQTKLQLDEIVRLATEQRNAATASTEAALDRLVFMTIAGTAGGALIALVLATFLANRTSRRINDAVAALSSSGAQIAAAVEQHERTAAQQAVSVNETTATMEELDASARQTDEQATAAAGAAREALRLAEAGGQQVAETTRGMTLTRERVDSISKQILRLSEQVEQIGVVTNVVGDLGGQVHMLALNAAVEASRAGEHGRGFSVVAAEIRKLADQSRRSAERISALVADIQKSTNATVMVTEEGTKTVEQGLALARQTAKAFESVAGSVNASFERSQQISLTAKQQAAAVRQVVEAMNVINHGARETVEGLNQTKLGLRQVNESVVDLQAVV